MHKIPQFSVEKTLEIFAEERKKKGTLRGVELKRQKLKVARKSKENGEVGILLLSVHNRIIVAELQSKARQKYDADQCALKLSTTYFLFATTEPLRWRVKASALGNSSVACVHAISDSEALLSMMTS